MAYKRHGFLANYNKINNYKNHQKLTYSHFDTQSYTIYF